LCTDFLLEQLDSLTDCRLDGVEAFSGTRETEVFGHGHEARECADIHQVQSVTDNGTFSECLVTGGWIADERR
jgi:hypothetical protein